MESVSFLQSELDGTTLQGNQRSQSQKKPAFIAHWTSPSARTDAKAETPIFWPPDAKSRLTGKDPDTEED